MKKYLMVIAALMLACVILTACGNDGSDSEHVHACIAVEEVAATCTEEGVIAHYRCDGCGKTFSDAEGKNEIADTVSPPLTHTGGSATCTQRAVCTLCEQEYGELKEHNFGEFVQTKAPTCTEGGVSTAECAGCDATKSEELPALGHSGEWHVVAEPRCFDNGEEQQICTVCDTLVHREIPSFNSHELMDSTCVGGKQCTRCNYVEGDGKGHAFDDWVITKQAKCTEDGTKERKCLVCGHTEYGVVLRTGHTGEWTYVTEPTCTENGEQGRMCASCSHYETKVAYKTGHQGEWIVSTEATCTTSGENQRTCTECGEVEKQLIPAGHTYGDWHVLHEPTCTENGRRSRYCSRCGSVQESVIDKNGHSMEWQITVEPTCTENGVKVGTCTACTQQENAVAEKLGHELQGGTCTDPSRCIRCGHAVMNTHIYGEPYEIIWPDCERHGIMTKTCTVCGDVYQYNTQPVGHTYSDWELRVAPTCTELGRERRECTVCGKAEDRVVELEEHTLGEWIILEDADCTSDGHKHRICTVCLDVVAEERITALGHDFSDATCTSPMICNRCSVTEGTRLSAHLLEYNTDYGLTVCTCCNSVLLDDKYLTFAPSDDGNSYWITNMTSEYYYLDRSRWSGIILPDAYEGKPVTAVMFDDTYGLGVQLRHTNLFIPKTVELIGSQSGYDGFHSDYEHEVFFESGSNLKVIGKNAFSGLYKLVSIELPEGLVEIGESAFAGCTKLNDVALPSTLERIGSAAFQNCATITNVILPDNLKWIGSNAFFGCTELAFYFMGSYEQWQSVSHEQPGSFDGEVYYYSETYKEPTIGSDAHSYWHYDENGTPTVWELE